MVRDRHLGVRVTQEEDFRLQLAAALENTTISELIRRALEAELRRVLTFTDDEEQGR